ncbi:hypothetical protein ACGFZ9_47455 [Streptomyces mirabilis]|uniref:hypothetical protein n=1 Tax=Streptomyces mirabilis TaxID=68239 RepID=UPI00370FDBA9
MRLDRTAVAVRRSTGATAAAGRGAGSAAAGSVCREAGARTCRARTFASGTFSLAAAISFGALQRSFVPYAGASGATSRRPVSASNPTARA